jgi:mRNA-degrading endonuclease toxin of MazEF toxin-antitoxin module
MPVQMGHIYFYDPPLPADPNSTALSTAQGYEQLGDRPWGVVSRDSVNTNQDRRTAVVVPLSRNVSKANAYRIQIPAAHLISNDPDRQFDTSVALCDHVRVMDVRSNSPRSWEGIGERPKVNRSRLGVFV